MYAVTESDRGGSPADSILNAVPIGVVTASQGVVRFANGWFQGLIGEHEGELIGRSLSSVLATEADPDAVADDLESRLTAAGTGWIDCRLHAHDGTDRLVVVRAAQPPSQHPGSDLILLVDTDHHRRQVRDELMQTERRLELALEGGEIGTYTFCMPSGRAQVDERLLALIGYTPGELALNVAGFIGRIHPDDRDKTDSQMGRLLSGDDDAIHVEYRLRHRKGHWVSIRDRARVYERDPVTSSICIAGAVVDISRERAAEQQLKKLAYYDELTRLPNRRWIWQSVERLHANAARLEQTYVLALLDLDHFKKINDLFGHGVGDQVLRAVAERLANEVREDDWLGRWGGEEMLVLLPDTSEPKAMATLERLRRLVASTPFDTDAGPIRITLSGGFSASHRGALEPSEALARADAALYTAKAEGRDRIVNASQSGAQDEVSMALLLQNAIDTSRLCSAYQPIVELRTGRTVGYELRARIIGRDDEVLPAADFLDVARQLSLMHEIDHSMLLGLIRKLGAKGLPQAPETGARPLYFAHLSGDLLQRPALIAELAAGIGSAVTRTGDGMPVVLTLVASQFGAPGFEVTDSLAPLIDAGCGLALGACGGALGSLSALVDLPIRCVELDPALLRQARSSRRAMSVLRAHLSALRELGLITLVKRIEDADTRDWLIELGIDWGQGYLFGAPEQVSSNDD